MKAIKALLVPRYFFSVLAFFSATLIFFFSTVPLSIPLKVSTVFSIDKLLHALCYFFLATFCHLAIHFDWKQGNAVLQTFLSGFLFGLFIEILQGLFFAYRSFELYDLLANTLGIMVHLILRKTILKIVIRTGIFLN